MARKSQRHAKSYPTNCQGAFTLIELLVVVSIIALLVSILLPALGKARRQAQATICATRLQELSLAGNMYVVEYEGTLPPLLIPWDGVNHNVTWFRYFVPYTSTDQSLSTGDNNVFIYDGAEGAVANRAGQNSILVCPEALKLCKLGLNSPTYGRNAYGIPNDKSINMDKCRTPSGTIFVSDSLVADVIASAFSCNNGFSSIGPSVGAANGTYALMGSQPGYHPAPHANDTINIAWYDGHVSRHSRLEYAHYEDSQGVWDF